jgi:hypothetical protein
MLYNHGEHWEPLVLDFVSNLSYQIFQCSFHYFGETTVHKREYDPIFLNKDEMYDEILDITKRFTVEHMEKLKAYYVDFFLHMKFDEPIVVLPPKLLEECKRLGIPMTDTIQSRLGPFGQ